MDQIYSLRQYCKIAMLMLVMGMIFGLGEKWGSGFLRVLGFAIFALLWVWTGLKSIGHDAYGDVVDIRFILAFGWPPGCFLLGMTLI